MIKNKNIGSIIFVAFLLTVVLSIVFIKMEDKSIQEHGVQTVGIIDSYHYDHNTSTYTVKYHYKVNGEVYYDSFGTNIKLDCKGCKGRKYVLIYSKETPKYNKLMLAFRVDKR